MREIEKATIVGALVGALTVFGVCGALFAIAFVVVFIGTHLGLWALLALAGLTLGIGTGIAVVRGRRPPCPACGLRAKHIRHGTVGWDFGWTYECVGCGQWFEQWDSGTTVKVRPQEPKKAARKEARDT